MNPNKYPLDFDKRVKKYNTRVFSPEDFSYLQANYEKKTVKTMSLELGFTTELLWRYMRKYKLTPLKARRIRKTNKHVIVKCIESFVATNSIMIASKITGMAPCTISAYIKRHYLKLKQSEDTVVISIMSKV